MAQWEYRKVHLNDAPARSDDIDLLNAAGEEGWELVGITSNSIAYLKREVENAAAPQQEQPVTRVTRRRVATPAK